MRIKKLILTARGTKYSKLMPVVCRAKKAASNGFEAAFGHKKEGDERRLSYVFVIYLYICPGLAELREE